jgi:23S rRNA (uridine2552-2'-O)-methyltransferase
MKRVQDHYFKQAKQAGYAARSAYKLEEIDQRRRLLRPGARVLDLGCAPGSWLQVAAARVGAQGRVVGVDLQPVTLTLPPQVTIIQGDVYDLSPEALMPDGAQFDVLLSDMAPRTSGIPSADAARSAELVRRVLVLCDALLKPGGTLLVKVFQGAQLPALRQSCRERFDQVSLEKPKASRSESVEVFLLGLNKRA